MNAIRTTIAAALVLATFACTPSKPTIASVYSQVNQVFDPKTKLWNERLAVFVLAQNADGIEDLDRLYLLHDTEELFYSLTKDTWSKVSSNSELWIGSQSIAPPPGGSFPTGLWRISLVARSGEKTSAIFSISPIPIASIPSTLETVSFSTDPEPDRPPYKTKFRLTGLGSSFVVWLKDASGNSIGTQKLATTTFQIDALDNDPGMRSRLKSLTFYSYDKVRAQGLIAGPYPVTLKGQDAAISPVPGSRR